MRGNNMYCIKCGVKLADSEENCPLCGLVPYHPDIERGEVTPLYPKDKKPTPVKSSKALNGVIIILFLIPLIVWDARVMWQVHLF